MAAPPQASILGQVQLKQSLKCLKSMEAQFESLFTAVYSRPKGQHKGDWAAFRTVWTDQHRQLIWCYETLGVVGLAWCITKIARDEIQKLQHKRKRPLPPNAPPADGRGPNGLSSWQKLVDDWEKGSESRMLFYLSSLPPALLTAVLYGDLPRKMQDFVFQNRYGHWTRLVDTPGTYAIYLALENDPDIVLNSLPSQPRSAPQPNDRKGSGFTIRQLSELLDVMRRYIDVNDQGSADMAQEIDMQIGSWSGDLDYSFQRRYGGGLLSNQFYKHAVWLDCIQRHIIDVGMAKFADFADEPLLRCPAYIGLGKSVEARCPIHWTHPGKETQLYGLVTAICMYLWQTTFGVQNFSYMFFRAVTPEDVGFVEILHTVLAGGYFFDLGFCVEYAGATNAERYETDQLDLKFARNADFMRVANYHLTNIDDSLAKVTSMLRLASGRLREQRQMNKDLQIRTRTEVHASKAKLDATMALTAYHEQQELDSFLSDLEHDT